MNIGEVAQHSGISDKTIRYYESVGLVHPGRDANGYRNFDAADLQKLVFINRARNLGFSIDDCRTLVTLNDDKERSNREVKQLAEKHLHEINNKIQSLHRMQSTLTQLVESCAGDGRCECPILDSLASDNAPSPTNGISNL